MRRISRSLSTDYLHKAAAIADVFRPYGMRVYNCGLQKTLTAFSAGSKVIAKRMPRSGLACRCLPDEKRDVPRLPHCHAFLLG